MDFLTPEYLIPAAFNALSPLRGLITTVLIIGVSGLIIKMVINTFR